MSSDKMTWGDWYAYFGEVSVGERSYFKKQFGFKNDQTIACLRATRDGKEVDVVLDKERAEQIIFGLKCIFGLDEVPVTEKLIEEFFEATIARQENEISELKDKLAKKDELKTLLGNSNVSIQCDNLRLQQENENLKKAVVALANGSATQIHDSITLEVPSEVAQTVAGTLEGHWREKAKFWNFWQPSPSKYAELGTSVHQELEKLREKHSNYLQLQGETTEFKDCNNIFTPSHARSTYLQLQRESDVRISKGHSWFDVHQHRQGEEEFEVTYYPDTTFKICGAVIDGVVSPATITQMYYVPPPCTAKECNGRECCGLSVYKVMLYDQGKPLLTEMLPIEDIPRFRIKASEEDPLEFKIFGPPDPEEGLYYRPTRPKFKLKYRWHVYDPK